MKYDKKVEIIKTGKVSDGMVVYKARNTMNDKIYIGITKQKLSTRLSQHKSDAKVNRYNQPFYNAINKYSWEAFTWEVIDTASSYSELQEKEVYWISFFNSYIHSENSNGYNATRGGEGTAGQKHTIESREKISEARMNDKVNFFQSGSKNPNSKLNEEKVREIRKLLADGYTQAELAILFEVHNVTISKIATYKTWRDVS